MSFFQVAYGYFTKKVLISLALVAVVGVAVFAYLRAANKGPTIETAVVARRNLQQEVDVTGRVQPTQEVELAFETGGKIVQVNGDVGDTVAYGQILALIDSSEVSASLTAARASAASAQSVVNEYDLALQSEQAKLDELRLGKRPEEIAVAQIKVVNAEQAIRDAIANLNAVQSKGEQDLTNLYLASIDVLNDAYTKADDAVVKYTDKMFSDDYATRNQLVFIVSDQIYKAAAEESRGRAALVLDTFASRLLTVGTSQPALDAFLADAVGYLATIQLYLNDLNAALQHATSTDASTIISYKADVSAARAGVVSASTAVSKQIQSIAAQRATNKQNETAAQNQISDAQNALSLAKSELSLAEAGTLPEQIRAQEAKVRQAETILETQRARVRQAWAEVQRISAQLGNYVLRAPFAGIITRQEAHVGEIVGANVPLVTVISQATFEVEANVPEADIAKIEVGDQAELTLDAYSDDVVFLATVSAIDPAQTTIEGVSTYKVTFQFAQEDSRIRSGMTANITVKTDKREDVLSVPQRAVVTRNGQRFVRMQQGGEVLERPVTVGLASADGYIEIINGLAEGEAVITSIRE